MVDSVTHIADDLADYLCTDELDFVLSTENPSIILAEKADNTSISLDLTPFVGEVYSVDAKNIFSGITTVKQLIQAYQWGIDHVLLDESIPGAISYVDTFAFSNLGQIMEKGIKEITDQEAQRISKWLQALDLYTAIKSLESLLNSKVDRVMLEVAEEQGWELLFDHLAIRCGSELRGDALRIVDFLCDKHGYSPAASETEQHYRFKEGWDAYPLYKQLENGLLLRLFVDESSHGYPKQIIQHWNRVYGYTAHHLAVRAICKVAGSWCAVPLAEFMAAMATKAVKSMTPTGSYTVGLLEQVFTEPSQVRIPGYLEQELQTIDPGLSRLVRNGKLIELVSRREMPGKFIKRLYSVYGLDYEADNPLHTCPFYTYFLPSQAAHVIRTSVEIG